MSGEHTNGTDGDELTFHHIRTDAAAFERFFKQQFAPLCGWCRYKFGFDLDEAKEAVHSGFIKLWEACPTAPGEQPVRAYLYRVITNHSLDVLKHQKVRQKHERYVQQMGLPEAGGDGFDYSGLKNMEAAVAAAIADLPEAMRRIFTLSRHEGLKYAQIADQLGISVKTVETQMSRALARLRAALADYLVSIISFSMIKLIVDVSP